MKYLWIWIVALLIALALGAFGGYFYRKTDNDQEKATLKQQIDELQSQVNELQDEVNSLTVSQANTQEDTVAETSGSPSVVSNSESEADDLQSAKDAVSGYLAAKKQRSLEAAKPYMTQQFYDTMDPVEFAGTSSPSFGSNTIQSAVLVATNQYTVKARLYQSLQGENVGYNDNSYNVLKTDSGSFLVGAESIGPYVSM